jgi:flavin reductase (DIM6/NTAB) family NADH-FMN oxidoreductase RutF
MKVSAKEDERGKTMSEEFRRSVLRKVPYGMYVMTATGTDGKAAASTLTWLSQCSFHPPLVMIAIQKTSQMHEAVAASGGLAVNLLGEGQREIAKSFFRPPAAEVGRFGDYRYEPGPVTGAPLLMDLPAWFEARITDRIERGDHTVFVAEVVGAGVRDATAKPLLLSDTPWNYGG